MPNDPVRFSLTSISMMTAFGSTTRIHLDIDVLEETEIVDTLHTAARQICIEGLPPVSAASRAE